MKLLKTHYEVIFVCIMMLLIVIMFLRNYSNESEIEGRGIFVMAKVTAITEGKKSNHVKAWFRYRNKVNVVGAAVNFTFYVKPGSHVMIQLLPEDPERFMVVENRKVPFCVDEERYMDSIWEGFPSCYSAPPEIHKGEYLDSSLMDRK